LDGFTITQISDLHRSFDNPDKIKYNWQ
jgi:hypothetical protein